MVPLQWNGGAICHSYGEPHFHNVASHSIAVESSIFERCHCRRHPRWFIDKTGKQFPINVVLKLNAKRYPWAKPDSEQDSSLEGSPKYPALPLVQHMVHLIGQRLGAAPRCNSSVYGYSYYFVSLTVLKWIAMFSTPEWPENIAGIDWNSSMHPCSSSCRSNCNAPKSDFLIYFGSSWWVHLCALPLDAFWIHQLLFQLTFPVAITPLSLKNLSQEKRLKLVKRAAPCAFGILETTWNA